MQHPLQIFFLLIITDNSTPFCVSNEIFLFLSTLNFGSHLLLIQCAFGFRGCLGASPLFPSYKFLVAFVNIFMNTDPNVLDDAYVRLYGSKEICKLLTNLIQY